MSESVLNEPAIKHQETEFSSSDQVVNKDEKAPKVDTEAVSIKINDDSDSESRQDEIRRELAGVKPTETEETRVEKTHQDLSEAQEFQIKQLTEALDEMRPDIDNLIKQLEPGIREGRWTAIIGDDVGGRFPALIIDVIATRYGKENAQNIPERLFLAAGQTQALREEALVKYVEGMRDRIGKRPLLVTEYIGSGKTIINLLRIFKQVGIEAEVASAQVHEEFRRDEGPDYGDYVGTRPEIEYLIDSLPIEEGEAFKKTKFYFGRQVNRIPNLYLTKRIGAGVEKLPNKATTSRLTTDFDQVVVNKTRRIMQQYVDEFYAKYFSEKES